MTYYYRPHSTRTMSRKPNISRSPRPLPKLPWRYIAVGIGMLMLVGLGWFGVTKIQGWLSHRSAESEAARVASESQRRAELEKSIGDQITSSMGGAALWEQKMKDGQTEEALVAAKITLNLQPNWRDGYLMLASSQIAGKNYLEAEESLLKALDLDPIYPLSHQLLATLYEATDKKTEAAVETEKATSLAEKTGTPIGG